MSTSDRALVVDDYKDVDVMLFSMANDKDLNEYELRLRQGHTLALAALEIVCQEPYDPWRGRQILNNFGVWLSALRRDAARFHQVVLSNPDAMVISTFTEWYVENVGCGAMAVSAEAPNAQQDPARLPPYAVGSRGWLRFEDTAKAWRSGENLAARLRALDYVAGYIDGLNSVCPIGDLWGTRGYRGTTSEEAAVWMLDRLTDRYFEIGAFQGESLKKELWIYMVTDNLIGDCEG